MIGITTNIGQLERNLFPFKTADGTKVISMSHTIGNAPKVESVGALSSEDGLTLPSFNISQANSTSFLGGTMAGSEALGET